LDKAHSTALEKLMEKMDDEEKKRQLNWALDGIKARIEPAKVNPETLEKYVGKYTRGEVTLMEGQLFIQAGPQKFNMISLSETYFIVDGMPDVRVEFLLDDKSEAYDIISHFSDGRQEIVKRVKDK